MTTLSSQGPCVPGSYPRNPLTIMVLSQPDFDATAVYMWRVDSLFNSTQWKAGDLVDTDQADPRRLRQLYAARKITLAPQAQAEAAPAPAPKPARKKRKKKKKASRKRKKV